MDQHQTLTLVLAVEAQDGRIAYSSVSVHIQESAEVESRSEVAVAVPAAQSEVLEVKVVVESIAV